MVCIGRAEAEVAAIEAVGFIASKRDLMDRFLASTGADPNEMRDGLNDPSFLAGVMQFLCEDDSLLVSFATTTGRKPEEVAAAAIALGVRWES